MSLQRSDIPQFRSEMAYPTLSDELLRRIQPYGREEKHERGHIFYSFGARQADMLVVLEGEASIALPSEDQEENIISRLHRGQFSGEMNLLSAQGSIVEVRATCDVRVMRVTRERLHDLMRAEGEVANTITQAAIWRRIGLLSRTGSGVVLMGHANDPLTIEIQRFLIRNNYPHNLVEPLGDGDSASTHSVPQPPFPAIVFQGGRILERPGLAQLADELGITDLPDSSAVYDVAVVGAGPAGLAAAVYAASEGLSTIVIESTAPGGQAGTSSKIENYLGFPTGISGQQLSVRAQLQALKFGVRLAISRSVVSATQSEPFHRLVMEGDVAVCARSVVAATGARYRKLSLPNYSFYEGRGIFYAATFMEAALCRDREVVVVGGGNSAGQASIFLSGSAKHVHHVIRRESLMSTMSQYLISRIQNSPHITLHTESDLVSLEGSQSLACVSWLDRRSSQVTRAEVSSLFVMIGAEPNSKWLPKTVRCDEKGFVLTGGNGVSQTTPFATSVPGIFAVGDVRSGSVKRVASAVGEGSVVISDVHRYLAECASVPVQPDSAIAAARASSQPRR